MTATQKSIHHYSLIPRPFSTDPRGVWERDQHHRQWARSSSVHDDIMYWLTPHIICNLRILLLYSPLLPL